MEGAWEEAGRKLNGRVKVGRVDATKEQRLASRFGVRGYPTIKVFPMGKKNEETAIDYEEERTSKAFVEFGLKYFKTSEKTEQLLNEDQFREKCVETKKACVIGIFPHLVDTGAKGREKLIEKMNEGIKGSEMPVKYFWIQGGDQMEMEEKLNLFSGYPALIVVHMEKGIYGVHRGTMEPESIRSFLVSLSTGGVPMNELPKAGMPKIKTTAKWDGGDWKDEL
jgi:protein disulfide-isomerase A6